MSEIAAVERADSDQFPWAEDYSGVWHLRPPGRPWINGDEANAETMCGTTIASVHVSNTPPEGALCQPCTTPSAPVDWPARFRKAADVAETHGAFALAAALDEVLWRSQHEPPHVVEAIGRAITGEGSHRT